MTEPTGSLMYTPDVREMLKERDERIAELESSFKRLNRVFKTTSDKTIDQDMQIEALTAERDALQTRLDAWQAIEHTAEARLNEANAKIERLSAPVSDAEINLHYVEEDGIGSWVASVESVNAIIAARIAHAEGGKG